MLELAVAGIEAVQVLQNAENALDLVAGRRTHVRVYLARRGGSTERVSISGRLKVTVWRPGTPERRELDPIECLAPLRLGADEGLLADRLEWSRSLNFELPGDLLSRDDFTLPEAPADEAEFPRVPDDMPSARVALEVVDLGATEAGAAEPSGVELTGSDEYRTAEVTFRASVRSLTSTRRPGVALRCRAVVMRYVDEVTLDVIEPDPAEVDSIRRYLENALPISELEWSTVTVDVTRDFRGMRRVLKDSPDTVEQTDMAFLGIFRQLEAIRQLDVFFGRDPRTVYLGVLFDPSDRMSGAAMDSPSFAAPHVVALSPPDGPIAAHEIGHVMGLLHPGIPRRSVHGPQLGQRDQLNMEVLPLDRRGRLSMEQDERSVHLGLMQSAGEFGERLTTPRVLRHDEWFDLMTYRSPKWLSDYTYRELLGRLLTVDGLYAGRPVNGNGDLPASIRHWAVVGEYNDRRIAGEIFYVLPVRFAAAPPPRVVDAQSPVGVRVGFQGVAQSVYTKHNARLSANPNAGVVYHVTNGIDAAKRQTIQLLVRGEVVDEFVSEDEVQAHARLDEIEALLANPDLPPRDQVLGRAPARGQVAGCVLEYSRDEDAMYFRYRWERGGLPVTTVIQGRPVEDGAWETVFVSGRLTGRVWISPCFVASIGRYRETGPIDAPRQEFGRIGELLATPSPSLRVVLLCGAHGRVVDFAQQSVPIEAFGSRLDGSSYAPEGKLRRDDANGPAPRWYRDTGASRERP